MMIARLRPAVLLLLLSATSSLQFTAGINNDPVEPSNHVDGPLPGEDLLSTSSSADADTASTTDSVFPATNDEDNNVDVALVPSLAMHPGPQYPAVQAPPAPYEHPRPPPQYRLSHQWHRLSVRPVYEVRTFKCDFEHHTCGMRNQKIIGPHFKLVSNNVGNRSGHYMAVDSRSVPPGVSRLITPYLPGYRQAHVCLQLAYAVYGPGAERIQVVAQDVGNRPLFTLEKDGQAWRTFAINMTVNQDVRFFIEAYTNGQPGVIAIDDFTYSFDLCR